MTYKLLLSKEEAENFAHFEVKVTLYRLIMEEIERELLSIYGKRLVKIIDHLTK